MSPRGPCRPKTERTMYVISHGKEVKVFAGNANRPLAEAICDQLSKKLGACTVSAFADGEVSLSLAEPVRGSDVFVVQSTCAPVNDNLMELLVMIDAMRRASAGRITAVMPYFGYARQDRKAKSRDPISAKLVANLITEAGADRVLTMDLHAAQIQGFFNIPLDHLLGGPTIYNYFRNKKIIDENFVVVSPDIGSVTRARNVAMKLNCQMAIIDKRRPKANVMEVMNIIGDIEGKKCLMVDDMIDTAGTICQGAQALMDHGAKEVYAGCTHAVFSGPAMERLERAPIKELAVLIVTQACLKTAYEIIILPVTVRVVHLVKRIDGSDVYDRQVSYNIFKIKDLQ